MKGGFDQAVGGRRLTLQKMTSSCKIEFELWRLKLHDSLFWKASTEKQNWAPFSLSFIYAKYFLWSNSGIFWLFSFFLNTIFQRSVDFSRIRTQIIGVEGKHVDDLTNTTTIILNTFTSVNDFVHVNLHWLKQVLLNLWYYLRKHTPLKIFL